MNGQSLKIHPRKILVSAMPYLGDVLLATPLIHSLRTAYPDAQIDVLVYQNTAAMLQGNPDIHQILTTPSHPTFFENVRLFKKVFRRYDLAMALQTSDRSFFYTLLAAGTRVNAVPKLHTKTAWKRYFADRWVEFDDEHTHTVLQNLKLLATLNIAPRYVLVPPQPGQIEQLEKSYPFLTDDTRYAVLHVHPQWTYKRWLDQGWIQLSEYLNSLGLKLVFTGSAAPDEMTYITAITNKIPFEVINLAGQVSLAELTPIITRAKLFIGPDTGITHLAAATGTPVIALYGPTNPVKWAPWPTNYRKNENPFQKNGSQQVNNVFLIQGEGDCVPCFLEGCDRHRQSRSKCLDFLTVDQLTSSIQRALEAR